ncbi:MAG: type I restriction endonuclease subunit R [Gemmataceae bacterium]|nr:type I restriction endonuclease subunit R [Gemmataceae bacterium]
MYNAFNETEFELTTIDRLKGIGYDYAFGFDLDRPDPREVVLPDRLRAFLRRRYPDLPPASVELAVAAFTKPDSPDSLRRNKHFHEAAVNGVDIPVELPGGKREYRHVHPIDWDDPEANDFLAVNQLPVSGNNDRRPDIVVYVNGLPLVLFELKNPFEPKTTAWNAWNQVQHYRNDIPRLFEFNALVVVSDGETTLHGQWPAAWEWYAPWRSIDGETPVPGTVGGMKALVEGLFRKDRLLAYVRDFVVFEEANEKITKKAARYHQFFAARKAADRAVAAYQAADKRVGVIWHTTGSGKSLSMLFLVGLLRRRPELHNPTVVIEVDRQDLDDQLADQFEAGRSLVGAVQRADSADTLRELLRNSAGGGVILSTIEKFRLQDEAVHPVLSDRANVFVVADEAHRSQYGFGRGFAGNLADALPNAKRIGFTGTPVSLAGADTVAVFGDLIHVYDLNQAQADKATVPIYYTPRQVKLHLTGADVDAALAEITAGLDPDALERRKGQWAALAAAAGAAERVKTLAADLLAHFLDRTTTMPGKGMIVGMTRRNCVALYDALTALPGCPEVKVVMTGDLGSDPEEWSKAGHLTTKPQREAIKARLADPVDPLKLVIVCDMWLTGTDIPCLHTLYVDKPMRGHTIIQAISRVNRVFRDKPHGLVVDYIGIGDELREAAARYSADGGRGDPAPDLEATAVPEFHERLAAVRALVPPGDYAGWRALPKPAFEDLRNAVYGELAEDDERAEAFKAAEQALSLVFLLVKHIDACRSHADEVAFYQAVRKQFVKALGPGTPAKGLEAAVRDLLDDTIETEGVFDLFRAAGLDRADLSVLDDEFLATFKDRPGENLRLKLLERLMADEIGSRRAGNVARAKLFSDRLRQTLLDYHNRQLDAAAVIAELVKMRRELRADSDRAAALDLSPEELAFYDAVATHAAGVYDGGRLRELVHDVVRTLKANLKADWTGGDRPQVVADLRAAVRRTLRKHGVKAEYLDPLADRVLEQAQHTFAGWPLLAA